MSRSGNPPRLESQSAWAMSRGLRTGAQKLNLVAALIRGKDVGAAVWSLRFSRRRIAQDALKVLQSAVANAENNHQLDIDRLMVAEAYVGKAIVMKRWRARARGRVGRIRKPFSRLTIVVRERAEPSVASPPAGTETAKAEQEKGGPDGSKS